MWATAAYCATAAHRQCPSHWVHWVLDCWWADVDLRERPVDADVDARFLPAASSRHCYYAWAGWWWWFWWKQMVTANPRLMSPSCAPYAISLRVASMSCKIDKKHWAMINAACHWPCTFNLAQRLAKVNLLGLSAGDKSLACAVSSLANVCLVPQHLSRHTHMHR